MVALNRRNILPIGLDIGHDSVKMVQLELSSDSLSVQHATRRSFENSEQNPLPVLSRDRTRSPLDHE